MSKKAEKDTLTLAREFYQVAGENHMLLAALATCFREQAFWDRPESTRALLTASELEHLANLWEEK